MVIAGRVSGLAVARALGDIQFKTPIEKEGFRIGKLVTAEPFTKEFKLVPEKDRFLIVGCDGVWEALSHQQSIDFVAKRFETMSPSEMSVELAKYAIDKGSKDNVSVIVVYLQWT